MGIDAFSPEAINDFLCAYSGMRVVEEENARLFTGEFLFRASSDVCDVIIEDHFELEITVANNSDNVLPIVKETRGRIPRNVDWHNSQNGTLCLASPFSLSNYFKEDRSMIDFAEDFIVPYLYGVCHKESFGEWPFGELSHGVVGELEDLVDLLGVGSGRRFLYSLRLLGMSHKNRRSRICPCGCGQSLESCDYNEKIIFYAKLKPKVWFRMHLAQLSYSSGLLKCNI